MKKKGFSFIEIIIAVCICLVVMVPLVAIFRQSLRQTEQGIDEIKATIIARSFIDEFRCNLRMSGFCTFRNHQGDPDDDRTIRVYSTDENGALYKPGFLFRGHNKSSFRTDLPYLPGSTRFYTEVPSNYLLTFRFYSVAPSLLKLETTVMWKTLNAKTFNRNVKLYSLIAENHIAGNVERL